MSAHGYKRTLRGLAGLSEVVAKLLHQVLHDEGLIVRNFFGLQAGEAWVDSLAQIDEKLNRASANTDNLVRNCVSNSPNASNEGLCLIILILV